MSCKVALLLSGGIDSTVAGYLLKKEGFDVHAFFLRIKPSDSDFPKWREAEGKALLSAKDLDIPFHSIDFRKEFKKEVVDFFMQEIKNGRTPNPCVFCNPQIKFGAFWQKIRSLGFDFMATGHYAHIEKERDNQSLLKGRDVKKDQSYFLYRLSKDLLPVIKFPLGELTKEEVRKIATTKIGQRFKKIGESQGVCFLQGMKYDEFIKQNIPTKEGKVLNKSGKVIGSHPGVCFFTEGQKAGIRDINYHNKPVYILRKNLENNTLTVSTDVVNANFSVDEINLEQLVFFEKPKTKTLSVSAKIRYGAKEIEGKLKLLPGKKGLLQLSKTIPPIASGQSVVFYDGNKVVGGGIFRNYRL